jgi:hypothetical protein
MMKRRNEEKRERAVKRWRYGGGAGYQTKDCSIRCRGNLASVSREL